MNVTTTNEEGRFWIELAPPFTDKLSKLKEFVNEHDLLGGLDKKFLHQMFDELEASGLHVTKFKAGIKKAASGKNTQVWTAAFTVNNGMEFKGEAESFPDAFLTMAESFESYVNNALTN